MPPGVSYRLASARPTQRLDHTANLSQSLFARNESHRTRLNLSDASPNFIQLCLLYAGWNITGQRFQEPVSEFGTLIGRKMFYFIENMGNSLGHTQSIRATSALGKSME